MTTIVHAYSRLQAIEDGVLVDVTEMAREAGIKYPTALTAAVYGRYVRVPAGVEAQDEAGRLWDILWMLRCHLVARRSEEPEVLFRLYVRNDNARLQMVTLKAVCGPGDNAEPVLTVMLPTED